MRIIVEEGDTLWDITKLLCGNGDRWQELAAHNKIKNPDLIYPGQQLFVPAELIPAIIESSRLIQGE